MELGKTSKFRQNSNKLHRWSKWKPFIPCFLNIMVKNQNHVKTTKFWLEFSGKGFIRPPFEEHVLKKCAGSNYITEVRNGKSTNNNIWQFYAVNLILQQWPWKIISFGSIQQKNYFGYGKYANILCYSNTHTNPTIWTGFDKINHQIQITPVILRRSVC